MKTVGSVFFLLMVVFFLGGCSHMTGLMDMRCPSSGHLVVAKNETSDTLVIYYYEKKDGIVVKSRKDTLLQGTQDTIAMVDSDCSNELSPVFWKWEGRLPVPTRQTMDSLYTLGHYSLDWAYGSRSNFSLFADSVRIRFMPSGKCLSYAVGSTATRSMFNEANYNPMEQWKRSHPFYVSGYTFTEEDKKQAEDCR